MTPDERSQALRDGEDAALALEKLPIDAARQSIFEEWAKSGDEKDYAKREDLWHELRALERVKGRLWAQIQGAKMAAHEIKADQENLNRKDDPYERA